MSLPAILWAMYEAPLPTNPTEKCVLMVLAEHADPKGRNAFPSWDRIAKIVGVSTRTIGTTLSSLQTKGLIRKGDQAIAEIAVRRRGKNRAYAPTVWDLVMAGSHAAATQDHFPNPDDPDQAMAPARSTAQANSQISKHAESTCVAADHIDDAGHEPCKSCRSRTGCQQGCSLTSFAPETGRRRGVKPASDKPSTSTKNINQPPGAPALQQETVGANLAATYDRPTRELDIASAPLSVVDELVLAVLSAVSRRLVHELRSNVLMAQCIELAEAGWSAVALKKAAANRSWHGAGAGAVIAWLRDPATCVPPSPNAEVVPPSIAVSSQTTRELRTVRELAAPVGSPARREALAMAAAASERARRRRMSTGSPTLTQG